MPLDEPQIQRFARQILLREVGGRGQEALLGSTAEIRGEGAALGVAAAYLACGGTASRGAALAPVDAGFLVEPGEGPWPERLGRALAALGPDGMANNPNGSTVALCAAPSPVPPLPAVVLGSREGVHEIWSFGRGACRRCAAHSLAGLEAPRTGSAEVLAGALAALCAQRLVLGLGDDISAIALDAEGTLRTPAIAPCGHLAEVPEAVRTAVHRHCESRVPEEACGVLLEGAAGLRFVALENVYELHRARDPEVFPRSARTAFLFEPRAWLLVLRGAEVAGERVRTIVHSHPDGPAAFSAEDRAQAAPGGEHLFPGVVHWVLGLRDGRVTEECWARWNGGGFEVLTGGCSEAG